jgi:hypothetical protein
MTYQQHLATAMVHLGDGDDAAALTAFEAALAEAGRVDPDGPRVAECLNYLARFHEQAGRAEAAAAATAGARAIEERFNQGL